MNAAAIYIESPLDLRARIAPLEQRQDWQQIAGLARSLPGELTPEWLEAADSIAFALGQLHETDRAVALVEAAHTLQPTARRAASLAYLFYDACLQRNGRGAEGRDLEADKAAFSKWIQAALKADAIQIKNLYRLGVFEAQVEHQHDRIALRVFLKAIDGYRTLDDETRTRRHDLFRFFVKSLYGGARSALRLWDLERARTLCFDCIREDGATNHVAPIHKLFLAGKICQALTDRDRRWLPHAERAFRQALDAEGPPRRDFVFVKLAEVALSDSRPADAERWIDDHIPPHRRRGAEWRLLGEIHVAQGRHGQARLAFQNSLQKDTGGRHLTLTALGRLQLALGELKDAERSFRDALKFRQRRYLSVHRPALAGLAETLERRGRTADATEVRTQLAKEQRREGRTMSMSKEKGGARPFQNTGDSVRSTDSRDSPPVDKTMSMSKSMSMSKEKGGARPHQSAERNQSSTNSKGLKSVEGDSTSTSTSTSLGKGSTSTSFESWEEGDEPTG